MAKKVEYAGFWIRLAAYIVDVLVVTAITIPLGLITGLLAAAAGASGDAAIIIGVLAAYFIRFIVILLYFPLMESSSRQATLGKQVLGLKVTGVNGEKISFLRALGRISVKLASSMFTYGIVFIIIGLHEKKQGLHDMIANTVVVRK